MASRRIELARSTVCLAEIHYALTAVLCLCNILQTDVRRAFLSLAPASYMRFYMHVQATYGQEAAAGRSSL